MRNEELENMLEDLYKRRDNLGTEVHKNNIKLRALKRRNARLDEEIKAVEKAIVDCDLLITSLYQV